MSEPTPLAVKVGPKILGRVLDGLGNPIDGLGPIEAEALYPVNNVPADPLHRQGIHEPFFTGVRAIDGVHPIGKGQRIGLFAGSGVGKSTLMSMIVKKSAADVVVCALVGERNREVTRLRQGHDGPRGHGQVGGGRRHLRQPGDDPREGLVRRHGDRRVLPRPGPQRRAAARLGHAPCDGAARDRPVGRRAAVGARLHAELLRDHAEIMERAGAGVTGTITAMYTVLVTGDDMNEPIADTASGILDGHMVLSRKLAHNGHYPAIDILQSISRLRGDIADREHIDAAIDLCRAWRRTWMQRTSSTSARTCPGPTPTSTGRSA